MALEWQGAGEPPLGIMTRRAQVLADRLRRIPGTEIVRVYGNPAEEIAVIPDPDQMALLGITPEMLAASLRAADVKSAAGTVRAPGSNLSVEVAGSFETIGRVAGVPLRTGAQGQSLSVGDVAEVRKQWQLPVTSMARSNGRPAVFVAARMEANGRIGKWAEEAKETAAQFAAETEDGIVVRNVFEQADYTNERLGDLALNLVLGALVIMLVVLAIMGWRSALIVSAALPLTGAGVLLAMLVLGGSLHQMSIFGMIIGLGLLIDNAIVVVDEVKANLARGLDRPGAMRESLDHLRVPLFASTLTTVLAFAPISLLPGSTGDFVGWIGTSVILSVGLSFVLAITVIAALAARFCKVEIAETDDAAPTSPRERAAAAFVRSLNWAMHRPWLAMAFSFALPVAGFLAAATLGSQFFPPVDRDMFDIKVKLEPSASVAKTDELTREVEAFVRKEPGVAEVHWLIGGSFPSVFYNLTMTQDSASNFAQAVVKTTDSSATLELVHRLEEELPKRFPSAQIVVSQFKQGPATEAPVQYKVTGPSIPELQRIGERIRLALMEHPQVLSTEVTMPRGEPRLVIAPREDEALATGLNANAVAAQVRGSIDGSIGGTVIEELEQLPVRVRLDDAYRVGAEQIPTRTLVTPSGGFLPVDAIADVSLAPVAAGITRLDGQRVNTVKAYVNNNALPIEVARQVLEELSAEGDLLPDGYAIALGGEAEQDAEAQGNLAIYAPLLVTAMLATLILTFRSVALAGLLIVVAGMSAGNALLATWAIGFPVSFNTILGTIGLIGLAFNNAIVVIAAIRRDEAAREGDPVAMVHEVAGCGRHILATTLTTAGGFLPLLIFIGGSFWPSLAVVLAGGVIGSMIVALYFVPAAFLIMASRASRKDDRARSSYTSPLALLQRARGRFSRSRGLS